MKTKAVKLIPPSKKQCQAEKPNGNTFMTLGGIPGRVRCTNKPFVIVIEREPNPQDGMRGMAFYRTRQCSREATMTADGKPYCSVHDPKSVEKRILKSKVASERRRNIWMAQHLAKLRLKSH